MQVEKSKASLDTERAELANELAGLQTARGEAEKKRKQADAISMELRARLSEAENNESELVAQLAKVWTVLTLL